MKPKLIFIFMLVSIVAPAVLAQQSIKIEKTNGNGFTIVENSQKRVLAYSTTPIDTTNPGLKWWLKSIEQLPASKLSTRNAITPASLGFPSVCEPMLTSSWGQETPYNWMCPEINYAAWGGFLPDAEHCPVGCVATATAQIMNYYKYPSHGHGTCSIDLGFQEYSVDLSQAEYKWNLILDHYTEGEYSTEQAKAVAELCYHVGVASRMGYRPDASATDNYYAILALRDHFDYDANPSLNIQRNQYSDVEWMRLVYTELSEGRPILYQGVGIDLDTYGFYGHSFVIDGYDADGLVNVNWGWSGKCNGHYDIALLNPSDLQFDAFQMMAIGIKPNRIHGDVDGDGYVTASDITALYNYMLNSDSSNIKNGDVDGDGHITSGDVTAVYDILLDSN